MIQRKRRNFKNSAVFGEYLRIKMLLRHSIKCFNIQVFKMDVGSASKAKNSVFFTKTHHISKNCCIFAIKITSLCHYQHTPSVWIQI